MINASELSSNHKISGIGTTTDLLADRGGLACIMRYLDKTGLIDELSRPLSKLRTGNKGIGIDVMMRQILAFFIDGTCRHLTYFDHLKEDLGYQALLEISPDEAISSHQVKRVFGKLSSTNWSPFRALLRQMFRTRLELEKPQIVELFLDTMVMNNDDALCRQGSQPTYKKVKGFQPLQLIWNGQIIDAQFRGGSKNGNHGLTAATMIKKAVKKIRRVLGYEIPVIVKMDGGFFDGELFWRLDINNIGFVCAGRMSSNVKRFAEGQSQWETMEKGQQRWSYFEFGTSCQNWKRFYRALYLKPQFDDDQMVLEFARPESVVITNLGSYPHLFKKVDPAVYARLCDPTYLINANHSRGTEELTHRALKDFGFEQLPFKKFGANMAFYYLMVIAFNIMEWFKLDVLVDLGLVGKRSYPTTVRRRVIDFAAKIVRTGGRIILKVTQSSMNRLKFDQLWVKCQQAPLLL